MATILRPGFTSVFGKSEVIALLFCFGLIDNEKLMGHAKETPSFDISLWETLSKSNHFRTRKPQNDNRGYDIILKFYCSKIIGFLQSSHSELSRGSPNFFIFWCVS